MNIDKATEFEFIISSQRKRLGQCRQIMRDRNMATLYPIGPEDFRKAIKDFAKAEKKEDNFDKIKTDERFNTELLIEFIEEKGLLPEELERFLRKRN